MEQPYGRKEVTQDFVIKNVNFLNAKVEKTH